jgi:hypothetical protein
MNYQIIDIFYCPILIFFFKHVHDIVIISNTNNIFSQ